MTRYGADAGTRYVGSKKDNTIAPVAPITIPDKLEANDSINIQQIESIVETEVGFKKTSRKRKYGKEHS